MTPKYDKSAFYVRLLLHANIETDHYLNFKKTVRNRRGGWVGGINSICVDLENWEWGQKCWHGKEKKTFDNIAL